MKRNRSMKYLVFMVILAMLVFNLNSFAYAAKPVAATGVTISSKDISVTLAEGVSYEFEVIAKYAKSKDLTWNVSTNLAIIGEPIATAKQEKVMVKFTGSSPGTYPELVTVTDGYGFSDTLHADITIEGSSSQNNPPVSEDLNLSTNEDEIVSGSIIATDPDGDNLSAAILADPSNGIAEVNGLNVSYTPNPNYYGNDSFTVTVSDGNGGSDVSTVYITINPVDDAPVAVDDIASTDINTAINIYVLVNDTDVDGGEIYIYSVSEEANEFAVPADSNSDGKDDYIIFTPEIDFSGTVNFSYTLNGGSTAAVSVNVNGTVQEPLKYVALGDSIPSGIYYTSLWNYLFGGTNSYSYVEQLADYLDVESANFVDASVSGYNTVDVFNQINSMTEAISNADIITLCVGANDIMDAAGRGSSGLLKYSIDWNVADAGRDNFEYYWWRLIDKIEDLNSDVTLVVMTIYNPYRITDSYYELVDPYFSNSTGELGLNYIINNTVELYDSAGIDIFADTFNYKVVDIYGAFNSHTNKDSLTGFYSSFCDPHPNQTGQNLIYSEHIKLFQ